MRKGLLCLALFFLAFTIYAQKVQQHKLKVFIDCNSGGCDFSYIKSEVKVVDFLLDRIASDVHVLITSQRTGSGGKQFQMIFYGQNRYHNYKDTLHFRVSAMSTGVEVRDQMVHYLMLGLAPLVAKTAYASEVDIAMMTTKEENTEPVAPTVDKWNYWVVKPEVSGYFNYDKVYKNTQLSTDLTVGRTTDMLKLYFNVYYNINNSLYQYEDTSGLTKLYVKNKNYGLYHNLVKTVSNHWSIGYKASIFNKTFSNYRRRLYLNPAIEYNIFNYHEVNNKFFVLRYGIDAANNVYYDTTIYNKTSETLFGQVFSAAVTFNKVWGSFNSGIYYHTFFNDIALSNLSMNLNLQARLTGSLSLNIYTWGSIAHDQLNLAKGEATPEDVLSRRRQLGSSFNFNTALGMSYRFGSKLNNFVNPRFEGYGGF